MQLRSLRFAAVGLALATAAVVAPHEAQASEVPEYVDQSNIIRAPATVGGVKAESFYFSPFGLERNVMVGLLHAPGATDGYALLNFHLGAGGSETEPDANGVSVRAAVGVPKAVVERGPNGRGAMIYVPIGGADHNGCSGVFDKGKAGADFADDCTSSGNDIAVGLQKKLGADGWMGFAAAINTWIAARTPDKVLADAKKEFEAWRKPVPEGAALCSENEKKLWRMGETTLRMGQVREPNIPGVRKNNGMMLASIPIGQWHTGWVRDGIYAIVGLVRTGHFAEAKMGLDFFMEAFDMNPPGMKNGKYKSYVRNKPYRISVTRHYGNGEEESDTNNEVPNVETGGWGLTLWAARLYVEISGDVAWLDKQTFDGKVYEVLTKGVAEPIEGQLEANGIMAADSSIWETHEANKRHFAYTTLTAARGLCDMAGIAKKGNRGGDIAKYQALSKRVSDGFLASFVDPQGALSGSLEGLSSGKYTDGAVAEAFTWNILKDWKGDTAKALSRSSASSSSRPVATSATTTGSASTTTTSGSSSTSASPTRFVARVAAPNSMPSSPRSSRRRPRTSPSFPSCTTPSPRTVPSASTPVRSRWSATAAARSS